MRACFKRDVNRIRLGLTYTMLPLFIARLLLYIKKKKNTFFCSSPSPWDVLIYNNIIVVIPCPECVHKLHRKKAKKKTR